MSRASNRTVSCSNAEDIGLYHRSDSIQGKNTVAAFRAMLLRRAYCLADWMPPTAVMNMSRVDIDPQGRFVLLTLKSGTQLLDTGERVTVRGEVDDVAVEELVACAGRRGWKRVVLAGSDAFRKDAARALLRQGIEVDNCPLSKAEQEIIRSGGADLLARGTVQLDSDLRI